MLTKITLHNGTVYEVGKRKVTDIAQSGSRYIVTYESGADQYIVYSDVKSAT